MRNGYPVIVIIGVLDLKQLPRKIFLRKKEVTPEYLRLGLPLDQSRHDEERKILLTERQKEYKELLAKVNYFWWKLNAADLRCSCILVVTVCFCALCYKAVNLKWIVATPVFWFSFLSLLLIVFTSFIERELVYLWHQQTTYIVVIRSHYNIML